MEKTIKDFEKEVRELSDSELDNVAGGYNSARCREGELYDNFFNQCLTKEKWTARYGEESAEEKFRVRSSMDY